MAKDPQIIAVKQEKATQRSERNKKNRCPCAVYENGLLARSILASWKPVAVVNSEEGDKRYRAVGLPNPG
jgi:hypothetical protein